MIVLLGILAIGALIWLGRQGHKRGGSWRSAASFLGLVAILGAVVLAIRNQYLLASLSLSFAVTCLMGVRKAGPHPFEAKGRTTGPQPTRGLARSEALNILGLCDPVTQDQVKRAHAHLIKTCHPDAGGSAHLAAQINAARDCLLRTTP